MTTNLLKSLSLAAAFLIAQPAGASLNIYLNHLNSNDLTTEKADKFKWSFTTSGTDPYVVSSGIYRDINPDEFLLTFDYKSDADISDLRIYVGTPFSEAKSVSYGILPAADDWTTCTVDISSAIPVADFGKEGDHLRLDFGNQSGIVIDIRNIRLTNGLPEDVWSDDNSYLDLEKVCALGLPVIEIFTNKSVEPSCEPIYPPAGASGIGITNAKKIKGSLKRIEPDGSVSYDTGEYDDTGGGMTLKVRGNTSATAARKPFKIKLQTKGDLLCSGDEKYIDKNWVLLNDYYQKLNYGFIVNELVGLDWTPRRQYVNVIINGMYRGVYLLCEAVERNTDCRINVKKTGFVVEHDAYWWNEDGYIPSYRNPDLNYTFKYPDWEDMDEATINSVAKIMGDFEDSLDDDSYTDHIDCESFARWILGHDILGSWDSLGSNMYYSRYDDKKSTLLRRPLMWDFDGSELTEGKWSNAHLDSTYKKLFESDNKTFSDSYFNLWMSEGKDICRQMNLVLSDLGESSLSDFYSRSMKMTNSQWCFNFPSAAENTQRAISWFTSRQPWLEENMKIYDPSLRVESSVGMIEDAGSAKPVISGNAVSLSDGSPFTVVSITGTLVGVSSGKPLTITSPGSYIIKHEALTHKFVVR